MQVIVCKFTVALWPKMQCLIKGKNWGSTLFIPQTHVKWYSYDTYSSKTRITKSSNILWIGHSYVLTCVFRHVYCAVRHGVYYKIGVGHIPVNTFYAVIGLK